jgi:hypothetical protein
MLIFLLFLELKSCLALVNPAHAAPEIEASSKCRLKQVRGVDALPG